MSELFTDARHKDGGIEILKIGSNLEHIKRMKCWADTMSFLRCYVCICISLCIGSLTNPTENERKQHERTKKWIPIEKGSMSDSIYVYVAVAYLQRQYRPMEVKQMGG